MVPNQYQVFMPEQPLSIGAGLQGLHLNYPMLLAMQI